MERDARDRWNDRYRADPVPADPSPFLVGLDALLPSTGRALDVAGGAGRNARYLAARGLDVTLVDVSDVALSHATAAAGAGPSVTTVRADLRRDPVPPGPWDLIICFHYLQRDLLPRLTAALAPGGWFVCAVATVRNLERHDRPPHPFVLEIGELPRLVPGVEIVQFAEDWFDDHHEARLVARRPA